MLKTFAKKKRGFESNGYCFKRKRLAVVTTANTSVNIPKTGWTLGYLVASQPAVRRVRIIGRIEITRVNFSFIPYHLALVVEPW